MSSYVLDRELLLNALGSARVTQTTTQTTSSNWIDANSNSNLMGGATYQRSSEAEIRKQMADLQDQLKMLKTDVDKKDRLIAELSSYREVEKCKSHESHKLDSIFISEKTAVEQTKRELEVTKTKYETISCELTEYKVKVQAKEERIGELKREIESLKNENGTMNALIVTMRNKIRELEGDLGGFETVASKSGITITTLQKDNKQLQQTVLDLESRIRTHMMEREEAERKMDTLNNKLSELTTTITTITGITITSNIAGLDVLITKVNEIVNENSMLKGKLVTTTENLTHHESENKANRETIQRLVNELNKIEKDITNEKLSCDAIKAERDAALNTKTVLEAEIKTLNERMSNINTAWQATKSDLDKRDAALNGQSANLKQLEYDALFSKSCLASFKEQVATLLSDGFVKVEANEDQIKEKVKLLMDSSKDRGLMIASMDAKIQQLANQLNDQITLYKELEVKYHKGEHHIAELETKIRSLDSEYCATEVLKDNLKSDRIKYLSFLEKVGNILKISQISADVGLDMNVDLILARIEQLVKMESDSIQDKQTNIYNLQRKIKLLKEQLDNKELHLDLLRKKLSALEEERSSKCALEREVDDHVMMSKKFKLKVEKLTEQLNSLKCENNELKAQLLDHNSLRGRSGDQEKEINKLLVKISDLEQVRDKQAIKITKMREEMDSVNKEVNKTRSTSDGAVHALSQELRSIKIDLEKCQSREKQLLDFRNVVARMLGLDITNLAVADYEIIARIERIITSFNEGCIPLHVQQVHQVSQPVHVGSRITTPLSYTHHHDMTSSSSSLTNEQLFQTSSSKQHHQHHVHVEARSESPMRHHHHHHHHRHESNRRSEAASPTRHRSKSPRKVTIDPNSY